MTELVKYDEACRALEAAVAVDEVQDIRNKAEAMRAYARQAKDRNLEIKAAQIRFRAERRLGELIVAQKETVGLAKGGQPYRNPTCADAEQVETPPVPTLEQAGIDRKLSSRAQRMAAIEPGRFEQLLELHRAEVMDGNNKVSVDLMRTSAEADGRAKRRNLALAMSDETAKLPTGRRFPVVYADPSWRRKQGVTSRSYENHYPTLSWDDICAMPVKDLLLPDAWVFLWIPRAHMFALHAVDMEFADDAGCVITRKVKLPLAWAVARAWGCEDYSTAWVWTKTDDEHPEDHGSGVIAYDQDEILLLFKRGQGLPKPATDEKFGSNHRERSKPLGHSRKPEFYRHMIASMAGGVPVLELFARVDAEHPLPPDWAAWGNEAQPLLVLETEDEAPGCTAPASISAGGAAELPVASPKVSAAEDGGLDIPAFLRRTKSEGSVEGHAIRPDARPTDCSHGGGSSTIEAGIKPGPSAPSDDRAEFEALEQVEKGFSVTGDLGKLLREKKLIAGKSAQKLTVAGKTRHAALKKQFDEIDKLNLLPTAIDQLVGMYGNHLFRLNERVLAGDIPGAAEEAELLDLLQQRANDNTTFGMACDDSGAERLRAENAALLGQEPMWMQRGVFRVVVDGIPHLMTHDESAWFTVHAEDADKPFLSESGFRSLLGDGFAFGCTVGQQAEAYISECIANVTDGSGKSKSRKKPMPMPSSIYRLPVAGECPWDAVLLAGSALSDTPVRDLPTSTADPAPEIAELSDDEIEMRKVLSGIAAGARGHAGAGLR